MNILLAYFRLSKSKLIINILITKHIGLVFILSISNYKLNINNNLIFIYNYERDYENCFLNYYLLIK